MCQPKSACSSLSGEESGAGAVQVLVHSERGDLSGVAWERNDVTGDDQHGSIVDDSVLGDDESIEAIGRVIPCGSRNARRDSVRRGRGLSGSVHCISRQPPSAVPLGNESTALTQ